jgi:hypothetical protein
MREAADAVKLLPCILHVLLFPLISSLVILIVYTEAHEPGECNSLDCQQGSRWPVGQTWGLEREGERERGREGERERQEREVRWDGSRREEGQGVEREREIWEGGGDSEWVSSWVSENGARQLPVEHPAYTAFDIRMQTLALKKHECPITCSGSQYWNLFQ